ncbi:MAG: amino acid transporter substrate-binding protein [Ramlibacter sp.]|jgi:branched-chain amino acid transport system substrate-binding protein|nr:amino acid transporter substrate-binding protein [Ramlibacter sp.]
MTRSTTTILKLFAFAVGVAALPFATVAQTSAPPIKIGWLVALTGPNSSPGIGFDRGIKYAVEEVNQAGGIKGRKLEVVTRDTQGDPTKAVNAALELMNREKVDFMVGPTNSGEGLATTPLIARNKTPSMVYGVVDTLIDPEKYPFTFRILPSNKQWTDAAHNYILKNLNAKKVALIGDATGYGTATVNLSEQELKRLGATISYKALIEANQSDVNSDMQKAKNSGAEVILVWSDSAALNARLINARAEANWTAPIVGHPALGSGAIKPLLTAPGNWNAVYNIGYKQTSFDKAGKLPDETSKFLASVVAKKVRVDDTTLWWIAAGYDAVQLIRRGYETAGSSKPEDVKKALESLRGFAGAYGRYTYTASNHNGYDVNDIVMNRADSFKDGSYTLAPGYGQ